MKRISRGLHQGTSASSLKNGRTVTANNLSCFVVLGFHTAYGWLWLRTIQNSLLLPSSGQAKKIAITVNLLRLLQKRTEMDRACSTYGERRNAYRFLVGKREGSRPLGRPWRRWEDNIKMEFREEEWGVMDWTDLAENNDRWRALVNAITNLRVS